MKKHIPNSLTCCNLLSGCVATYFAFQGAYTAAFIAVVVGAVFDFFDGFVARLLHVASPIGKELDSLADDITFGLAPATVVFSMMGELLRTETLPEGFPLTDSPVLTYVPFVAFLIAAFSALRLAKFNLDERQSTTFIGLPTPANALFWCSLAVVLEQTGWLSGEPWLVAVMIVGVILSCWLMVAEVPMFALKFKHYGIRGNEVRYSFLVCAIVLLGLFQMTAFPIVIILYVLTSLLTNKVGTGIVRSE